MGKEISKAIMGLIGLMVLLVSLPIWYYLLYKILESVNASELMWFLYWIYAPVSIVASIVVKIAESID